MSAVAAAAADEPGDALRAQNLLIAGLRAMLDVLTFAPPPPTGLPGADPQLSAYLATVREVSGEVARHRAAQYAAAEVYITVTCPRDRAVDVAADIARRYGLKTTHPDGAALRMNIGAKVALPVDDVDGGAEGALDQDRNAAADGEHEATFWKVSVATAGTGGHSHDRHGVRLESLIQRIFQRGRDFVGHLNPLAAVVDDRHNTSPSLDGVNDLSVGEGPATGGDPAGPGHPNSGRGF